MSSISSGKRGEQEALKFLKRKGYKILDKNFRSRFGEIDIVAQEAEFLVFVEVKTRWSHKFGYPEEAVTFWKLRSIIKTGQYYKLLHPKTPELMRVDVVALDIVGDQPVDIRLIKNVTQ